MTSTAVDAQRYLNAALGPSVAFRDGQLDAILALVDDRARVLVIQRTGWGKSIVYFLATRLLRDRGAGPTVIISPLLSLVRDQMSAAAGLGLRAVAIDSTNVDDWRDVEGQLAEDDVDVLLISPERLANRQFREQTLPAIARGIGMFVVDEAHCISDWGHDFRPDYQRVNRIVAQLPPSVPLLATTATANDRVQSDVAEQLGPDLVVVCGALARDSLALQVVELDDPAERLAWLAEYLEGVDGSGIIYTLTTRDADGVSRWLETQGIDAPAYHSQLEDAGVRRPELEARLKNNEVKALVATVALGMGFDKPDLAFVVHYQRPGSVVAYYQQIGRAGRALNRAEVVLLAGREDDRINDFFISSAMPSAATLETVLAAIAERERTKATDLRAAVNIAGGAIDQALKFLDLDNAISRDADGWFRTINPWSSDRDKGERLAEQRREENRHMQEYVTTTSCRMVALVAELDDPYATECGSCDNCAGDFTHAAADPDRLDEALEHLRRTHRVIKPRIQWAPGLGEPRGNIPVEDRLQPGRALCRYGDPVYSELIRAGKSGGAGFDSELLDAVLRMLGGWEREVEPTWVTAVPSRRLPELVPDFAGALASRLGLPYRDALVKVRDTPAQKTMQNPVFQARNALEGFGVDEDLVDAGPVFLVDDMVDSRWSLTVCGTLLADAGSGPVVPIALCETTRAGDT